MATYNVNGTETDSFEDALNLLRNVRTDAKAADVQAQHAIALQKPTSIDLERAVRGVSAPSIEANAATATLAARAEAAANEATNN